MTTVKSKIENLSPGDRKFIPKGSKISCGFTLIEVVAALLVLSMILTSVMVAMTGITESMIDLRSRTQAFDVARQNMEELLSSTSVSDKSDFGFLEWNPDISWQTVVEPFYEPISKRMWIRGVCTAGYTDSKGERQTIELSCWLTGLTAEQIRQIIAQQKQIEKLMEEFAQTEYGMQIAERHQINLAFLRYKEIDVEGYKAFIEQLERRRMDYLAQYGIDDGYQELADILTQEEFDYMYPIAPDDGEYVNFYKNYDPQNPQYGQPQQDTQGQSESGQTGQPEQTSKDMSLEGIKLPADFPKDFLTGSSEN
jgi:prepilin-type N-terminal cleavage/methylation domain-containing protein